MLQRTAEGLIRASIISQSIDRATVLNEVTGAYLRWYRTQTQHWEEPGDATLCPPWLLSQRELYAGRAPGSTCMRAMRVLKQTGNTWKNDSKGCGSVMRVAPVGILCAGLPVLSVTAMDWGAATSAITHGHPTGQLAAGALAMLITDLLRGLPLPIAVAHVTRQLATLAQSGEVVEALTEAERLAQSSPNSADVLVQLGEGWIAEESLAIAVYCALSTPDLPTALRLAVNHDGDSDSTGAITGNIAGCMYGVKAIPAAWLDALELRDVISQVADDLAAIASLNSAGSDVPADVSQLHQRYGIYFQSADAR